MLLLIFVGESGSVTLRVMPGAHFSHDSFTTDGLKNYLLSVHNQFENYLLSIRNHLVNDLRRGEGGRFSI